MTDQGSARARALALYLPQYHPTSDNDEWWGKGFTEWTNVTAARPRYPGHQQPILPGELGFYDLRIPEVREHQAELARSHGVEGFVYWHYWFGAGRRTLERPFDEVLASGAPDFPFALAWANRTWSGHWHGAPGRVLLRQTYSPDDHRLHFEFLESAFHDPRHVRVDGRPLFYVLDPLDIPDCQATLTRWWRASGSRSPARDSRSLVA